jgi:hypothetical protein
MQGLTNSHTPFSILYTPNPKMYGNADFVSWSSNSPTCCGMVSRNVLWWVGTTALYSSKMFRAVQNNLTEQKSVLRTASSSTSYASISSSCADLLKTCKRHSEVCLHYIKCWNYAMLNEIWQKEYESWVGRVDFFCMMNLDCKTLNDFRYISGVD